MSKRNRQPGDSPPANYLCMSCNAESGYVECDWCSQWEHRVCAEEELKVLYLINSNVKFFCKLCNPKVEMAFTIKIMKKKQDLEIWLTNY